MNTITKLSAAVLCSILFAFNTNAQTPDINTFAGNGTYGYSGDGGTATAAELKEPAAVTFDGSGNAYIADYDNNRIRKVNTSGIISTIAGIYLPPFYVGGYSGDGGPATAAELARPDGIAVDGSGNVYFADSYYSVIRVINTSGIISTIAGDGLGDYYSGDGGQATAAGLNFPAGIAVDGSGNVYIADQDNNAIRMVNTSGIISTIAGWAYPGGGYPENEGYSGDGGLATAAALNQPAAVALDGSGNIYIADQVNNVIRKINSSGIISTIAGNGYAAGYEGYGGYSGDGGPATAAELYDPDGVAVDATGNIYISDSYNYVIRMVNTNGIISTIAGDSGITYGSYWGDGGPATTAGLYSPAGLGLNSSGTLYIADQGNNVIRYLCNGPSAPGNIVGDTLVCLYTSETYSIAPVSGATSYTWTLPFYGPNDTSTTNSITIDSAGYYYLGYHGYDGNLIGVTANNDCGSSATQTLAVNLADPAGEPNSIYGQTAFCAGEVLTYYINSVPGATNYTWELPYGWIGNSMDTITTDTSITITTNINSGSGYIQVYANNCGGSGYSQYLYVSSNSTPTPGNIFGNTTYCPGEVLTYYINSVPGATSYTWTLPYGWIGNSTDTITTDTSITVTADSGYYGEIDVSANGCGGSSFPQYLYINLASPPSPDNIFGNTTYCAGSVQTYYINSVPGATSYTWEFPYGWTYSIDTTITDTSITIVTSTYSNGGYIDVSANSCGQSYPQSLYVSPPSAPVVTANISGNTVFCPGAVETYYINSVPEATSYTWSLPYGWTGNSTDTSITTTTNANNGAIEVSANGCWGNSFLQALYTNFLTLYPPSICYVTVDNSSSHNDIFWDRSSWDTLGTDSVVIYKEATSSYVKIGEVSVRDSGSFIDVSSNPNTVSNLYEMALVDTCGQLSYPGSYQETILLQASLGVGGVVNLSWNTYTGNTVDYYRIMRDDSGTGAWHKLDSVPNSISAYTDNNPPHSANCRYRVSTIWNLYCTPSLYHGPVKSSSANTTASESNIEHLSVTGVNELNASSSITVYPNPVNDELNVVFNEPVANDAVLNMTNVLGQNVYSNKVTDNTNILHINMSGLEQGVYILKIETNGQTLVKKIIKM